MCVNVYTPTNTCVNNCVRDWANVAASFCVCVFVCMHVRGCLFRCVCVCVWEQMLCVCALLNDYACVCRVSGRRRAFAFIWGSLLHACLVLSPWQTSIIKNLLRMLIYRAKVWVCSRSAAFCEDVVVVKIRRCLAPFVRSRRLELNFIAQCWSVNLSAPCNPFYF